MSEVHEVLMKVHDILDNAVSKQVGNSPHNLGHVFNSASRQCHEFWVSQFPYLHSLKDVIPPSEACLYGCINWSLAHAQQQSSIGLSQSFTFRRDGNARPQTVFHFTEQRRPMSESRGASLAKRHHLESRPETYPGGKKSASGSVSATSADAKKMGAVGVSTPDMSQSSAS